MAIDKEIGTRGSKLCIQVSINNITGSKGFMARKDLLDKKIGLGSIEWISPLWKDNFQEYELRNLPQNITRNLGLDTMDWSFWKTKQPQWDAIGFTSNAIVLVEAKAHPSECVQNRQTSAITNTKEVVERELGNNPLWQNKLFQIANRLIFLRYLKKHYGETKKVVLIFLYFVNDSTYSPTTKNDWECFIQDCIYDRVKIPEDLVGSIKSVYFDVWREK